MSIIADKREVIRIRESPSATLFRDFVHEFDPKYVNSIADKREVIRIQESPSATLFRDSKKLYLKSNS
jgi:hypothetical protein